MTTSSTMARWQRRWRRQRRATVELINGRDWIPSQWYRNVCRCIFHKDRCLLTDAKSCQWITHVLTILGKTSLSVNPELCEDAFTESRAFANIDKYPFKQKMYSVERFRVTNLISGIYKRINSTWFGIYNYWIICAKKKK